MTMLQPPWADPTTTRVVAAGLLARREQLDALGAEAVGWADRAHWDSPAGEAFATRLLGLRSVLSAVADRFAAAATALRDLADVVEVQGALARAAGRHHQDAVDSERVLVARLQEAMARPDPDVVELESLGLLGDELRSQQAQWRARFDAARDEVARADRVCAARLRAATRDGLDDHGVYAFVSGVENTGARWSGIGLLGGVFPPAAVVGVVCATASALAEATRLAVWQEGSWGSVAVDGGLAAAGGFGRSLRAGAAVGPALLRSGASAGRFERLLAGLRVVVRTDVAELATKAGRLRAFPVVNAAAPAGVTGALAARWARAVDRERSLLLRAAGAGPSALQLYAVGTGSKAVSVLGSRTVQAKEAVERVERVVTGAPPSPFAGTR